MALFVSARVDGFIDEIRRGKVNFPVNEQAIYDFLQTLDMGWLLSYGVVISSSKTNTPVTLRLATRFSGKMHEVIDHPIAKTGSLYVDNGGYQIQTGRVAVTDIPVLASYYYQTVQWPSIRTYTLDIAPGSGFDVDEETMRRLSIDSCEKALLLPAKAKKQMHYVLHFRTPALLRTARMLMERGYADPFQHFATGGIASNRGGGRASIIGPVVPLIRVLDHAAKKKLNAIRYHVFGAATPADLFEYRILEAVVSKLTGIKLTISADTTSAHSVFAQTYTLQYFCTTTNRITVINLASSESNPETNRNREVFADLVTERFSRRLVPGYGDLALSDLFKSSGRQGLNAIGLLFGLLLYVQAYRQTADAYEAEIATGAALLHHKTEFIVWASGWLLKLKYSTTLKNAELRALRLYRSLLHIEQMCPRFTEEVFLKAVGE